MADNDDFEVTPWDVEGHVDYQRLIDKFGTERLTDSLKQRLFTLAGQDNLYLRRDFIFSHRDLDDVLDNYEDGDDFFLYTGRAPSGKMHIGHIVSFYLTKWFQDAFNVNVYIQIPDDEKYWAKDNLSLSDIDHYATENIRQIAAVGFDPDKTFIFRNREYISNMYDAAIKVSNEVNYSVAQSVFGFQSSTNIGMSFYHALPCRCSQRSSKKTRASSPQRSTKTHTGASNETSPINSATTKPPPSTTNSYQP